MKNSKTTCTHTEFYEIWLRSENAIRWMLGFVPVTYENVIVRVLHVPPRPLVVRFTDT